jgi:hypothetical protein
MGLGFGFLLILVGGFSWLYGIGTILSCSANATHGNCWDPNNAPESMGASGDMNRVGAEAFYFGLPAFAVWIIAVTGTLDVVLRIIGDISSSINMGSGN